MSIALRIENPTGKPGYLPSFGDLKQGEDIREKTLKLLQDNGIFPFTEEDGKVFMKATKATQWADFCVSKWGYAIGIITPLSLTLALALVSLDIIPVSEGTPLDIGVIITTLLVVGISNAWSMYATGDVTAKASEEQNIEQNYLEKMKKTFDDLGTYMLMECSTRQGETRMKNYSERINVERIFQAISNATTQKRKVELVLKDFGDVIKYIKTGDTSNNSELEFKLRQLKLINSSSIERSYLQIVNYEQNSDVIP